MPQQEIILLFQAFVAFVGDVPSAAERWQDDRFYGSQFLNGCNPDTIKRCIELPSKFPVTQETGWKFAGRERYLTESDGGWFFSIFCCLYTDRDDLPKNLPKTSGQESKTSTSV